MPSITYESPDEIFTLEVELASPHEPATGPTYSCGGTPAYDPEFEITEWRMFGEPVIFHVLEAAGRNWHACQKIKEELERIENAAIEYATEEYFEGAFDPE